MIEDQGVDKYMDNIHYHSQNRHKTNENKPILGNNKFVIFLILIVVIILVFFYFKYNQRYIVQASYGEIEDSFITEALIIRDEKLALAPISGKVVTHCKENERISYGQKIITIKGSNKKINLYNQQSGIISYATDGLENILKPEAVENINCENYGSFNREYNQLVKGNRVDKGSPAFRIINNYKIYLVIKTDVSEAQRYHNNELIFIEPAEIDKDRIEGHIVSKKIDDKQALLVVKLNRFIEEWLNTRRVKIKFIKNIYRGIIIPQKAVFSQPEGEGVLVYIDRGNYKFKKVKIKHKYEDKVIVTGLEIGDNVILNPAKYNYGRGEMENGD